MAGATKHRDLQGLKTTTPPLKGEVCQHLSAILGKPELVLKFLSEMIIWRGLIIVDSSTEDEIMACELASKVGLDFDDGLQYFYAKRLGVDIVSLDKDFDKTDLRRLEPIDILKSLKANTQGTP